MKIIEIEYESYDRAVERHVNAVDEARREYWHLIEHPPTDRSSLTEQIEQAGRKFDILLSARPLQGRSLRLGSLRIPFFPKVLPGTSRTL